MRDIGTDQPRGLVECVPNISEGKDAKKIRHIVSAITAAHPDVLLLNVEADRDYNRTVITFAGPKDAVIEGAFACVKSAAEVIDMRTHHGGHPRIGATDVLPFVPLDGFTMPECVALAKSLGERIGGVLHLPVYLYAEAATSPQRRVLADIRKGEYEGLPEKLANPLWKPDYGPVIYGERVARSGATVVGARTFLIAYNVNLATEDLEVAREIAGLVRTSGRKEKTPDGSIRHVPGSLEAVQAMGVALEEHHNTQVSMNLLDFRKTGLAEAFEEVRRLAEEREVNVTGSEIVGLVPLRACLDAGVRYLGRQADEAALVQAAVEGLGLSDLGLFAPDEKIIEYVITKTRRSSLSAGKSQRYFGSRLYGESLGSKTSR